MHDSTIVWHTYPEEFVQMSKPTVAWQPDETRGNIIITDHIEQGLYDLQIEYTWEAFKTICPRYHIITCDCEIDLSNGHNQYQMELYNIIMNSISLMLKHSIFIIRIDLHYPDIIHCVHSVFRNLFDRVVLWYPNNEIYAYCTYLIGINLRSVTSKVDINHLLMKFSHYGSAQSILPINRYICEVQALLDNISKNTETCYNLMVLKPLFFSPTQYPLTLIPIYGIAQFSKYTQSSTQMDLTKISSCKSILSQPSRGQWQKLGLDYLMSIRILNNHLAEIRDPVKRGESWDPYAYAHRTQLLQKLFYLYGFEDSLKRYHDPNTPYFVSTRLIYHLFSLRHNNLEPRDYKELSWELIILSNRYLWENYMKDSHDFFSILGFLRSL